MSNWIDFQSTVRADPPRDAVVLGSGLAGATAGFDQLATVSYADIPGLVPPSVQGHRGQLAYGQWGGKPVLIASGRVHFYEGHDWPRVTRLVGLVAELGAGSIVLTNAAGGLRDDLKPGDLMAITGHVELLEPGAWKTLADGDRSMSRYVRMAEGLPRGIYAGLTGPCYETPAEIRALRSLGIDAVGMSTVREVAMAARLGLRIAGVSCITNKAAGLGTAALSHREVEETARTAVSKLSEVLLRLIASA